MVMTIITLHLLATWVAVCLDNWLGDPSWLPHPVRGFGYLIAKLEEWLNKGRFRTCKGVITWFVIVLIAFFPAFFLLAFIYETNVVIGLIVEALLIFTTIAEKSLEQAGRAVEQPLKAKDIQMAREKVSWIVGRDTDNLDEAEVVRATVETIAENTSDGVTAPLFFAVLGGAPLALLYRAVNTCDSMLGYKNERFLKFGWASARLDDLFNLIPSRLTGYLMVLGNALWLHQPILNCLRILHRDAPKHPSPNSGWLEAAMAALLQVQLGGLNYYKGQKSDRARMGDPINRLQVAHIGVSITIMKRTVFMFMIVLTIGVVLIELAFTWSKSAFFI